MEFPGILAGHVSRFFSGCFLLFLKPFWIVRLCIPSGNPESEILRILTLLRFTPHFLTVHISIMTLRFLSR
jgi:hypothetical protein